MFSKHVRLVVGTELGAMLKRGLTDRADPDQPVPDLLYVLADGQQLQDAIVGSALPAADARFAGEAALDAYALPLLHGFLERRRCRTPGAAQTTFGAELVANFQPVGSQFDRYLVRLFDGVEAALARMAGRQPYGLGLRTAGLDMAAPGAGTPRRFELVSAIYAQDRQLAILEAIYSGFEHYYVASLERFGAHHAAQVLVSCWNAFRQAAGAVLPRFRPPAWRAEREWIAVAPYRAPQQFELAGNLLVPALALRAHGRSGAALPIARILLHQSLPQPLAADSLRQFFRFHQLAAPLVASVAGPA